MLYNDINGTLGYQTENKPLTLFSPHWGITWCIRHYDNERQTLLEDMFCASIIVEGKAFVPEMNDKNQCEILQQNNYFYDVTMFIKHKQ